MGIGMLTTGMGTAIRDQGDSVRYIVRTVDFAKDRLENVAELKRRIPQLEVDIDTIHDCYKSLFRTCDSISEEGGVIIEDDVVLCRNFMERVEGVIAEKGPENLISFFEKPKVNLVTRFCPGAEFLWSQCVYYPPKFNELFHKHWETFQRDEPRLARDMHYDCYIRYVLKKEGMRYWRIRPTYVQHLDFKSAISPRSTKRQTSYFIDDVEDRLELSKWKEKKVV